MFSNTITLLATTYVQNDYGEWVAGEPSKKDVFCDLQSLGANEKLRGTYKVYRTFVKGDRIELYLASEVGLNG